MSAAIVDEDALATRLKELSLKKTLSGVEEVQNVHELHLKVKNAGFEAVVERKRYTDISCNVNGKYVCFYDPKMELTCQVSLDNHFDFHNRELLQAYARIDDRVELFIFAAQKTLEHHGRSKEALVNSAIAMIAIHYLQLRSILPQLLHHQSNRVDFGFHTGSTKDIFPKYSNHILPMPAGNPLPNPISNPFEHTDSSNTPEPNAKNRSSNKSQSKNKNRKRTRKGGRGSPIRPFDKSTHKASVLSLLSDFLEYATMRCRIWEKQEIASEDSAIYEDYENVESVDLEGKKCNVMFPATAHTCVGTEYSGMVVQDPFVLDRNLTPLYVGWRFKSTCKVFRRAHATVCGFPMGLPDEIVDDDDYEGGDDGADWLDLQCFQRKLDRMMYGDFGDARSGPTLKKMSRHLLYGNLGRYNVDAFL
ncbi:hypothetical protein BGX29_003914 [Mortierella sp. GBA35]|nr:hypothetical protein BGX29_003914 [Mortierella sp. GBA35]